VSGRIVNAAGTPLAYTEVVPYELTPDPEDPANQLGRGVSTDAEGRFTMPVHAAGMKLEVWQDNGGFLRSWYGGASWQEATPLTPTPGLNTEIGDITLNASIEFVDYGPQVKGVAKLGSTVTAQKADWRPFAVTRQHQWYYVKNGVRVRLPNATHYYYKITSSTLLGKNLQFRETASYPGATPVSTFSPSVRVVRPSYISSSVSSPSRGKVKVGVTLKITGISKPDAKVKVRYAGAFTATLPVSQWPYKSVSVNNGKGSVTISGFMPTETARIRVELAPTTRYAGDTVTKSVTVRR
jgi:hypothetical protein